MSAHVEWRDRRSPRRASFG